VGLDTADPQTEDNNTLSKTYYRIEKGKDMELRMEGYPIDLCKKDNNTPAPYMQTILPQSNPTFLCIPVTTYTLLI